MATNSWKLASLLLTHIRWTLVGEGGFEPLTPCL
jgi:hypothetical protein